MRLILADNFNLTGQHIAELFAFMDNEGVKSTFGINKSVDNGLISVYLYIPTLHMTD